jgi:hypothetical protein
VERWSVWVVVVVMRRALDVKDHHAIAARGNFQEMFPNSIFLRAEFMDLILAGDRPMVWATTS